MIATAQVALDSLPETRRAILEHLKRQGTTGVESISTATTITVSGARQHLVALERDGLITHHDLREGKGRPKHLYALTPAGDALFPRNYAELANELLEYVEVADPHLLQQIFAKRAARRLEQARLRLAGLAFAEKVRVLAQILDEDGYLADFQQQPDGSFVITEHNCAVLSVARRYNHACSSELSFLQAALPEAELVRIAHQLVGGHVCAYSVRLRA